MCAFPEPANFPISGCGKVWVFDVFRVAYYHGLLMVVVSCFSTAASRHPPPSFRNAHRWKLFIDSWVAANACDVRDESNSTEAQGSTHRCFDPLIPHPVVFRDRSWWTGRHCRTNTHNSCCIQNMPALEHGKLPWCRIILFVRLSGFAGRCTSTGKFAWNFALPQLPSHTLTVKVREKEHKWEQIDFRDDDHGFSQRHHPAEYGCALFCSLF